MGDEPMEVADPLPQRWTTLNNLTKREPISRFKGEYFDPTVDYGQVKILVVGAGGLGCEILKDLALSGFKDIEVIDMDTIDLSNLNRQFLFRQSNIGHPKAECAAKFVMNRVPGVQIVHHYGRIEEKPDEFYQQFNIVILGLDSLNARLWMTNKLCELLQWEVSEDGTTCVVDEASIIPVIDGGTEGFKGHARVIKPTVTATFEESMWMFPPQVAFPMCTIESTPRLPEHCVAYAKEVLWGREKPFGDKPLDGDSFQHITWITERAKARADEHNIKGVDYRFAQGVVKNIIPAIAATNALVSAACVSETLKMASGCGINLDNYFMYNGASIDKGLHSESFALEPSATEGLATPPHLLKLPAGTTVAQLVERMKGFSNRNGETIEDTSKLQLSAPRASLVQTGVLAARTAANMEKPVFDFLNTDPEAGPIELVTVTSPAFTTVRLMLLPA